MKMNVIRRSKCKKVAFCYTPADIEKAPAFMKCYMKFVKRCCNGTVINGKCENEEKHCEPLAEVLYECSDGIWYEET